MDLHTCLLLGSFPCNSFTKTKWGKQNIRVPSCALFSSISIHVFGNSTSSRQKWCPHEAIWRSQILIMSLKQSSTHFPRNNHGASHCNCHDDRASLCKLWEQQSSHCFFSCDRLGYSMEHLLAEDVAAVLWSAGAAGFSPSSPRRSFGKRYQRALLIKCRGFFPSGFFFSTSAPYVSSLPIRSIWASLLLSGLSSKARQVFR